MPQQVDNSDIFGFYNQSQEALSALPSYSGFQAANVGGGLSNRGFVPGYVAGGNQAVWQTGQATPEQTGAQDLWSLMSQAIGGAQSGDYSGLQAPAEGMTEEQYLQYLNLYQNMLAQNQVTSRADQAMNLANTQYGNLLNSDVWGNAQQLANQPVNQMDWNLYDRMRTSAESLYDPRAAGISAAASGGAGSSSAQLAANQARSGNAANIANMYSQALQQQEAMRASELNRMLSPTLAQASVVSPYVSSIMDVIGRLYGSPEFLLNS